LLHGPVDGAVELRRTAEPVAEGVGELREPAPGERVGEGLADQPGGGLAVRSQPAGRGLRMDAGRTGGDRDGQRDDHDPTNWNERSPRYRHFIPSSERAV